MPRRTPLQANPLAVILDALHSLLKAMIDWQPFLEDTEHRRQCASGWRSANRGSAEQLQELVSNARRLAEVAGLPSSEVEPAFNAVDRAHTALCKWGSSISPLTLPLKPGARAVAWWDLKESIVCNDAAMRTCWEAEKLLQVLVDRYAARISAQKDVGKPGNPRRPNKNAPKQPRIPSALERPMKLWPRFEKEMKCEHRRATVREFRKWLKKHQLLDLPENFGDWRKNYMRIVRRQKTGK
jgi:hypothetical protein